MKKAVSALLLAVLVCSASLPGIAQTRNNSQVLKRVSRGSSTLFATANAFSDGTGVFVTWQMEVETNNFGFNVYRTDSTGRKLVSPYIISGSAARVGDHPSYGESYSFFDPSGDGTAVYSIEAMPMSGKRLSTAPFAATFVSDLKSVGGFSPDTRVRDALRQEAVVRKNDVIVSQELAAEIAAGKKEADLNTHRFVISQPGVRIGTRKEGFYRVSKSELQAAGFDVGSDSSFWQLYNEGVEQAIIVGPNADYIEFFGKGVDTPESDTRMYYLISGPVTGKRIGTRLSRALAGAPVTASYAQAYLLKQRVEHVNDILNGDAENYYGIGIGSFSPTAITFDLSGVDFNNLQSTMTVRFQGFSNSSHIINISLNGHALEPMTGSERDSIATNYSIETSFLVEGTNSLVLQAVASSGDFGYFDSVSIDFERKFLAGQNQLKFFTQNFKMAKLDGFASPNIRVFDTTFETQPTLMTNLKIVQNGGTYGVTIPASKARLAFAVEDSGLLAPVSVTPNNPTVLSNPADNAHLIIVSYKDWMTEAENWANYRRGQGFTVKVVEVSEIYDEFNFGVLSADSIKDYLEYANTSWQAPPQYVLFLGDASYDSRNYEGTGFFNFVPTRIVNTQFTETGSDEFMADFNNDGLAEMAVGRISARNAQTIADILARTIAYEQNLSAPLDRGATFAHDLNIGYDFLGMSNRLKDQLPASVASNLISRGDADAHNALIASMNTGKFIVNFSGHGSVGSWATGSFFSNLSLPELSNANNRSIYTMLTCLNGYFLNLRTATATLPNTSLAENLMESPNGGAIAAWASTGLTTPDVQEAMATRFYNQLGLGNITRMGDLVKDAKTAVPGAGNIRLSWVLLGDPMLKVR